MPTCALVIKVTFGAHLLNAAVDNVLFQFGWEYVAQQAVYAVILSAHSDGVTARR